MEIGKRLALGVFRSRRCRRSRRFERVYVIRLAREVHQSAKLPSSARREFSQTKVTPPTYYQNPSDQTVIELNYQQAVEALGKVCVERLETLLKVAFGDLVDPILAS